MLIHCTISTILLHYTLYYYCYTLISFISDIRLLALILNSVLKHPISSLLLTVRYKPSSLQLQLQLLFRMDVLLANLLYSE